MTAFDNTWNIIMAVDAGRWRTLEDLEHRPRGCIQAIRGEVYGSD